MKKNSWRITGFCIAVCLFSFIPADAYENRGSSPKTGILKSLAINRSLLSRFEAEYSARVKEEKGSASDAAKRELTNIQYKIKALDEENTKLTQALPETLQANEFLKDMLAKTEAEKNPIQSFSSSQVRPQFIIEEAPLPLSFPSEAAKQYPESLPSENKPVAGPREKTNADTYKLHERALEFVAKKDLKNAIKLYEEILLMDPNDDEAYLIMGHCLVLTGNYEKAEETFQNAVHINPEDVNQIAPFYENLAAQNPSDSDAFVNLGFVYLMLGNLNRANEAFKEALSLNPQNQGALRGVRILENHPR